MDKDNEQTKPGENMASYSTKPPRLPQLPAMRLPSISRFKSFRGRPNAFIAAVLVFFAAGFGGGWVGSTVHDHSQSIGTSTAAKQQYISNESQLIASIAKTTGQSVVSIDVTSQTTAQDFFGFTQTQNQQAAGTGFIISASGIIITNRHVVPSGTTSVSVTLADGTSYDNVQVIGRTVGSSSQDVAFLKIADLKGKTLVPVTLGDSSKMQVGDKVIAIGNALGQFQNTVTSGIISGYGRDVTAGDRSGLQSNENLTDLFQTDAAINEGNSGGPLVNINGQVIGINTAVASGAQNIGFAQPINELKGLISSVLGGGKLQQPYLGVRYVSITPDIAAQYNLSVNSGAYVVPSSGGTSSIVSGSPAAKAGLKEKDIITKVGSASINNTTSLTAALSQYKVGDTVTLTVIRGGKTITLKATLEVAPTD